MKKLTVTFSTDEEIQDFFEWRAANRKKIDKAVERKQVSAFVAEHPDFLGLSDGAVRALLGHGVSSMDQISTWGGDSFTKAFGYSVGGEVAKHMERRRAKHLGYNEYYRTIEVAVAGEAA